MLDVKPSKMEQFYHIYDEETVGTMKVVALSIEDGTFLPTFQMQYHDNETIGMIKVKVGQVSQFSFHSNHKPTSSCFLRVKSKPKIYFELVLP